ncbi:MAG TPA: DUF128 domain-containing protein [Methanosarcinaceae archaeon]|nr:DUF128 domain-containing protein [Methanosarcinaceae archaeon]
MQDYLIYKLYLEFVTPDTLLNINNSPIQFISSKIEDLMFKTTFDPLTGEGDVIVNVSLINEKDLSDVVKIYKMAIMGGLSVSPYAKLLHRGDEIGDIVIEKGNVGIATVCSITIDGVLLKAGIPLNPILGGIAQIKKGAPVRFTDTLMYASTTIDPLDVFMSQKQTSIIQLLETGSGNILANLREAPMAARNDIERTLSDMMDAGFSGILEVSEPNTRILDVPVERDHLGIAVIGGTNPMASVREYGIPIQNNSMFTMININDLIHISEIAAATWK